MEGSRVAKQFKHLETNLTNKNSTQEEIKRRLTSGNACYHSAQNLHSRFLSKNIKIRTYRTQVLPILYGDDTLSLTWWEGRSLRGFENRAHRRIFGRKRDNVTGE
jgi:hypothetical protein